VAALVYSCPIETGNETMSSIHISLLRPVEATNQSEPSHDNNNWQFAIGDIVDHVLGGMRGRVRSMGETTAGRQVFAVELIEEDDRQLRIMRGDFLKLAE